MLQIFKRAWAQIYSADDTSSNENSRRLVEKNLLEWFFPAKKVEMEMKGFHEIIEGLSYSYTHNKETLNAFYITPVHGMIASYVYAGVSDSVLQFHQILIMYFTTR